MSSIEDDEAIIKIKVELVADVEGEIPTAPDPFSKDEDEEEGLSLEDPFFDISSDDSDAAIAENIRETSAEAEKYIQTVEKLTNVLGTLDADALYNLQAFARSPPDFLGNAFTNFLGKAGPYGALATAIVGIIISGPETVEAIVKALGMKGGPINQDFKFTLHEEQNQQFDRHLQYKRLAGDNPVITFDDRGYVVGDADFVHNSLVSTDISRTARVGLRDAQLGVINGI